MAFKRKQDGSNGEAVSFETKGQAVKGVYLGSADFVGKYGPSVKHIFKTESGIKIAFGTKVMNELLNGETGKLVILTFTGTKPSGKGNPTKLFSLDIDDTYQASDEELAEAEAAMDDEPTEDDDISMDEVVTAAVKTRTNAQPPSAANQAAVRARLAGLSRNK